VIGCGSWGENLVRHFHRLGALSHACDSDPMRLQSLRQRYPGVATGDDFQRLLKTPGIDAIVIATPAEQHSAMAAAALAAGKHVFVEKPLALRYGDGVKLVQLANRARRILMVGHLLEYHPAVLKLRELVDGGELGKIHYVYSNRLNLGKVRREENILWSFAPHDIAVILRLVGDLPLEVTATGGAYVRPNLADVTVTNFLFDNGVRAHIFVSWLHPYKEQRLVVIGSKKMASFDDVAPRDKLLLYDQGIQWIDGAPVPRNGPGTPVNIDPAEPLGVECEHFIDCLKTGRSPKTDGASALDVLQVLQACQRSLQTHGEPVQMTTPPFQRMTL
jgi:UDP-2-acetamido-3-amino-2,3-dideoxy-glucuronate N-acetyltransferase